MFENITKGEFKAFGSGVFKKGIEIIYNKETKVNKAHNNTPEDAEFIAYCFNLQQRFDISKLEEAVEMLEESNRQIEYMQQKFKPTGTGNSVMSRINSLITQIKK